MLGELRVVCLIGVSAEVGRHAAAQKEVGESDPPVGVRESSLIDDLRPGDHCLARTRGPLGKVLAVDAHELATVGDQRFAERLLVPQASLADELSVGSRDLNEFDPPSVALLLEPREVSASQEVIERRRRQMHTRSIDSQKAASIGFVASACFLTSAR